MQQTIRKDSGFTVHDEVTRILIVEDHIGLNDLSAEVLQREGFKTMQCSTGREAIRIAENEKNLLILIDFKLPDTTGKEVAEAAIQSGNGHHFLVMTGHGDEKTAVEMMRLGARDYIVKEADFISLLPHVVRRALDQIEKERRLERTERLLKQREQALHSVYHMATGRECSFAEKCNRAVASLAKILRVPCALARVEGVSGCFISQHCDGRTENIDKTDTVPEPCRQVLRKAEPQQTTGNLSHKFPYCHICRRAEYHSYVGVPIVGHANTACGYICIFDTAHKAFSEEDVHLITIFAQYLGHEVEHEAMEAQIRHGQEMKLLGQLTSGVAHEVRNPLNAIGAMIEALFSEIELKDGLEEYRDHLHMQVERLSNLMHDLLALGRPANDLTAHVVCLQDFCRDTVEAWNSAHVEQGAAVVFESACNEPVRIHADSVKLQQALINLIENASQHNSPDNAIQVRLLPGTRDTCVIQVIDGGKGIDPDQLGRIFEPFFTTRREGTGLGLSIVRRVIEMHNGRIVIGNNEPPPGVTVAIELPRAAEQTPNPATSRIC